MGRVVDTIDAFLGDYYGMSIPNVNVIDIVEIIIIAFFLYRLLLWCKNTRAWWLLKGIGVILAFFVLAALLQMSTILWLGEKLLSVALIALVVVFQPELRSGLERLGRRTFLDNLFKNHKTEKIFSDKTLEGMVKASYEMGAVKTGALIVIEKDVLLTEYVRTGIELDSVLSSQLLINIFEKNTPLHDGAVIVRGDRVVSATSYLPLSDNISLSKELGTRHRAAVGISEVSDALTIVVSEETGKVSVTQFGKLTRDVDYETLVKILKEFQQAYEETQETVVENGGTGDER